MTILSDHAVESLVVDLSVEEFKIAVTEGA